MLKIRTVFSKENGKVDLVWPTGYAVIAVQLKSLGGLGEQVPMWRRWLYAIPYHNWKICLSPIGLSMVSKLAPLRCHIINDSGLSFST